MRIDRPAADVDDRLTCGHQGLQGAFNLPLWPLVVGLYERMLTASGQT